MTVWILWEIAFFIQYTMRIEQKSDFLFSIATIMNIFRHACSGGGEMRLGLAKRSDALSCRIIYENLQATLRECLQERYFSYLCGDTGNGGSPQPIDS